jgi:putative DNA primase/helicase
MDIFQSLMCQYCKTVEPSNFVNRGNKAGGVASPEMIALDQGTRIGILSEITEEDELNETLLKKISGGDVITYRTLYQKEMKDFVSEAKCIILTNHKPKCTASQSMLDRIRYIDFNARFTSNPVGNEIKRNPELVVKLKNELLPIVLRWCLDGTQKYIKEGLIIPMSLQIENDSYGESQNSIQRFLKDKTEEGNNYSVSRSELYDEYKTFCKDDDIKKVIKMSEFNKKISLKYGPSVHKTGGDYYNGLRMKIENTVDENEGDDQLRNDCI